MYETPGCMWCRQWHAEIGPGYPKTAEGQRAPLRIHKLNDPPLPGLSLAAAVTLTPTFVLADGGKEVGRIAGHPGNDFFYPRLNELFARLPQGQSAPSAPPERLKTAKP